MGPCTWEHMTAWGWRVLCTSLDTTVINLLCVTHIDSQGLHLSWHCFPCGLRNGQMRAPCTDTPPSGLEAIASDSWAVRLATVPVATCFPLGRGRPTDTDSSGWTIAPWRSHTGFCLWTHHSTLYLLKTFGLQSIGLSHQVVSFPASENWPTTIDSNPKKIGKTKLILKHGQKAKKKHQRRIKRKKPWKTKIPRKVALSLVFNQNRWPTFLQAQLNSNCSGSTNLRLLCLPFIFLRFSWWLKSSQCKTDYHKGGCCPDTPEKRRKLYCSFYT